MSNPTLVLVPGAWHKTTCYDKIIKLLEGSHGLKCIAITLPSTTGNRDATFKDDIDAARDAISRETTQGRDVVVISHSYGGLVGSSAIRGFARPGAAIARDSASTPTTTTAQQEDLSETPTMGHVIGLILIASGFNLTGLAFMDPFFGRPPPFWRVNKETGYADLVTPPQQLFYHDLPADEADYWTSQLTTQSLKALFEGGEHAHAGWADVPAWYIGTVEDQGLPVVMQRMSVGMARGMGGSVEHRELRTSHSPFLSRPDETAQLVLEAVEAFTGKPVEATATISRRSNKEIAVPEVRFWQPLTWFRFGLPLTFGRIVGTCILGFGWSRRLWRFWFN